MKTYPAPRIHALALAGTLALALAASPGAAFADSASPSPSLSELLERGIYSEETKGDIDGAISIYQQLVAQAKANESLVAQAEFRLAQCYLKKNRKDDATAEFQKLVDDFPDQTALVAQAKPFLPGAIALGPVPWVDGERLQMKLYDTGGNEIGFQEYRSNLVQTGSGTIWRVGGRLAAGMVNTVSSVDADAATFHPISSRWNYAPFMDVSASYGPGRVILTRKGEDPVTVKVHDPVIDNEQAMDFIRRLPLKPGYKVSAPVFSTLSGMEIPIALEVKGKESVTVPAGTFNCFKVQLSVGQTFWFSDDAHRYLVMRQLFREC
jgi:hypothetical protein